MHKHEDIRKATQILGIQADKWGRVFQGRGSVKTLPTIGSAGILPAYGNPGVSSAKNSIDSSSPNGSAGVSPANEPAQAKSAKGWYSRDYLPHLDSLVYCLVLIGDMSESPSGQLLGARS